MGTSEKRAVDAEQAERMRKMWASSVLAMLSDTIRGRNGCTVENLAEWSRSRDGHEVLTCAGIVPGERTTAALIEYVERRKL